MGTQPLYHSSPLLTYQTAISSLKFFLLALALDSFLVAPPLAMPQKRARAKMSPSLAVSDIERALDSFMELKQNHNGNVLFEAGDQRHREVPQNRMTKKR